MAVLAQPLTHALDLFGATQSVGPTRGFGPTGADTAERLPTSELPSPIPSPPPARSLVPIGDPRREREMVCDFEAGLGFCPAETGFLGPLDRCRRQIGTIGFQLGGEAICWSCFVRLTAAMASAPAPTVDTSVFETSVDSASQARSRD